jgi:hypothetical protein
MTSVIVVEYTVNPVFNGHCANCYKNIAALLNITKLFQKTTFWSKRNTQINMEHNRQSVSDG